MESQLALRTEESFDVAKMIYQEGGNSKSYAQIVLQTPLAGSIGKGKFAVWICFVFGFEFVRDTIVNLSNCRTACAEQFLANQSDRANLHACVSFSSAGKLRTKLGEFQTTSNLHCKSRPDQSSHKIKTNEQLKPNKSRTWSTSAQHRTLTTRSTSPKEWNQVSTRVSASAQPWWISHLQLQQE